MCYILLIALRDILYSCCYRRFILEKNRNMCYLFLLLNRSTHMHLHCRQHKTADSSYNTASPAVRTSHYSCATFYPPSTDLPVSFHPIQACRDLLYSTSPPSTPQYNTSWSGTIKTVEVRILLIIHTFDGCTLYSRLHVTYSWPMHFVHWVVR